MYSCLLSSRYRTPDIIDNQAIEHDASGTNNTIISDLYPYTVYQAKVKAQNDIGESLPSELSEPVRTNESGMFKSMLFCCF